MRKNWTNCEVSSDGLPSGGERSLRGSARAWMAKVRKELETTTSIAFVLAMYANEGCGMMPDWCESDGDYADWAEAAKDEFDPHPFVEAARRLGVKEVATEDEANEGDAPAIYRGELFAMWPDANTAFKLFCEI